jgi:hypothetical protein
MGRTRFDALNRSSLVAMAGRIADLALAEAKKSGAPVLYMTKWDIAQTLGADTQTVTLALRLAYTSEFYDQHGYSFVPPGSGRSGAIYGYVLLHNAVGTTDEALVTLHDGNEKRTDHLNGAAMHFRFHAAKFGRNTKLGKRCDWLAKQLDAAVATAEQVQEESEKLLT